MWLFFFAMLAFIMQVGFLCIETGLTRRKNNINVTLKNISNYFVCTLIFFLCGYGLVFGRSVFGLVGMDSFMPELVSVNDGAFFIFQLMFATATVTIVSGAVAERVRFKAYILITMIVSLVIYPVYGHWVWAGINLGESVGWLAQLGFVDFAGASVVHSTGGWIALALLLIVGARAGRYNEDGSVNEIKGSNLPLASFGAMLLFFGWFGFNGGHLFMLNQNASAITINTALGASGGFIAVLIYSNFSKSNISTYQLISGILVGLVSITASAHVISPISAIVIGAVGGVLMIYATNLLYRLKIDDVVGAVPVHLVGGIWGALAVGIFGTTSSLGTGLNPLGQITIQLVGIGVGALWAFVPSYILFYLLNQMVPIRVASADERIGLNVSEHGASIELISFLHLLDQQSKSGDITMRAPIQPFTEVGQIAERYNGVMDRLEQRDDQLSIILNNSPLAIFSTDIFGVITQVEGSFLGQLGIKLGSSIYKLLEDNDMLKQNILSIFEGQPKDWVTEIREMHAYFRCHPIKDETDRVIGLTGVVTDITPQRIAAIEREKYVDMLSTFATISEQITTISDIQQLIETILSILIKKYGLYHAAVLMLDESSQSLRFVFGPDEQSKKMQKVRNLIPLNHSHSLIARSARQKKVVIANDVSLEPNYLIHPFMVETRSELAVPLIVDNQLIGVLDIQENIAARFEKPDVDLFVSISRQIAIAIRNATSFKNFKQSEARMKAALQRSIIADKAKDDFLARVSHELRTPLGVILGYAELLQDEAYGSTTPEQDERLDDIINSSNHLTELVNQLLDSAKLNSGKIEPTYKLINLPILIGNISNQMSVLAKQKGLLFRTKIDEMIPEVIESDSIVIRQMLINLLGNAIKFTDKGFVSLEVLPKDSGHIAFVIKDTGIGIPKEFQKRVFEPFQQVDGSRTRTHEGTGLGLAITKRMAEILGGMISLNSIEGRGSQFVIILPISLATSKMTIEKRPTIRSIKMQSLPEFEKESEFQASIFSLPKEQLL
ncbi:MAG: ammonium transporter [Cellvibrionaceae bacterium]|jgi:ammonium transporter